jgi:hypothetical protein
MAQLEVTVLDVSGRPVEGATVYIYRRLPLSQVASSLTDVYGKAYFDGLWPWGYVAAADYLDMTSPPVCFNVEPLQTYSLTLTVTPPPHLYEVRIQCGVPQVAYLEEWLVENLPIIRQAILSVPNAEFVDAWVEDSYLVVRFRVTGSSWVTVAVIVGLILAIVVVLAVLGWEIREVIVELPEPVLYALGVAAAALGVTALIYAFRKG